MDRDTRFIKNTTQGSLSSVEKQPSLSSMLEGQVVIADDRFTKQVSLSTKKNGKIHRAYLSSDGNQYVDKDLEVKGKTTLRNDLTVRNNLTVSGNVGIGEVAPEGNLHISSLTDATIILEADTDDTPEGDNPRIELRQDGNGVNGYLGITGAADSLYTGSLANTVYLESKNNNAANSNIQFVTGGDLDAPSDGTVRMTIRGTGQVGIGTNAPSANADLTLESGVLNLKETTTPTADTNYGKIYTKNDNKLYFQDGEGNEYTVDITAV